MGCKSNLQVRSIDLREFLFIRSDGTIPHPPCRTKIEHTYKMSHAIAFYTHRRQNRSPLITVNTDWIH